MKKIFFLFLLIPALAQAQSSVQLPVTHRDSEVATGVIADSFPGFTRLTFENSGWTSTVLPSQIIRVPDCEAWERFSAWEVKNTGKAKCEHNWVVAEWREVNGINYMQTSEMPPPCGRTRCENEARICRHCLRHETRIRMYGMKEVERKSEFLQLLEKINDR